MAKNGTNELVKIAVLGGVGYLVLRMLLKADEPRVVEQSAGAILCERCSRNEPCAFWREHRNLYNPADEAAWRASHR